jgi:hypothetical protein
MQLRLMIAGPASDIPGACSKKRGRPPGRTAAVEARFQALFLIAKENAPCSARNIYYGAVVAGVVPKTESGYVKVQRALVDMRREGTLPFAWITDSTRWMRKQASFDSAAEALMDVARFYRRNLWSDADERLEVWCESESIAGVISDTTYAWDVPLLPTRGFASLSFLYSSTEDMNAAGKPVVVYYVGDHDPSGLAIEAKIIEHLDAYATVPVTFERIGVTWDQVEEFDLPGSPPKSSKNYHFPMAVEAEALPAPWLREQLEQAILRHVDGHRYSVTREAEKSERNLLMSIANGMAS